MPDKKILYVLKNLRDVHYFDLSKTGKHNTVQTTMYTLNNQFPKSKEIFALNYEH